MLQELLAKCIKVAFMCEMCIIWAHQPLTKIQTVYYGQTGPKYRLVAQINWAAYIYVHYILH